MERRAYKKLTDSFVWRGEQSKKIRAYNEKEKEEKEEQEYFYELSFSFDSEEETIRSRVRHVHGPKEEISRIAVSGLPFHLNVLLSNHISAASITG